MSPTAVVIENGSGCSNTVNVECIKHNIDMNMPTFYLEFEVSEVAADNEAVLVPLFIDSENDLPAATGGGYTLCDRTAFHGQHTSRVQWCTAPQQGNSSCVLTYTSHSHASRQCYQGRSGF